MIRFLLFLFYISIASLANAANTTLDVFQHQQDIGEPKLVGSAKYLVANQTYHLVGGGKNIGYNTDEFHYLFNEIEGDFIATANFAFVGEGHNPHRNVGWMIRQSRLAEAAHISAVLHGDGLTVLQWRERMGASMRDPEDKIFPPKYNYTILQLERKGPTVIMRAAHPGEPLQKIGSHRLPNLSNKVLAGIFINSHDPAVREEARVWNVRISQPVADDYNNDPPLGSRLEILTVFDDDMEKSGHRHQVYHSTKRFEAPNWMPDGKALLVNMEGSLYTVATTGGKLKKLNTGKANRNNNDHGISFDGKLLAISHHREGLPEGGSSIYVLPLAGGKPKLVTEKTPSYWHGWHPNNEDVVYVAKRKEDKHYNIFKKNIHGGDEIQLTFNDNSHVDGPEYSPDGKYIYYNGNQSGTMQIWRMSTKDQHHEQLTFNETNDWFPHISPDGKWIIYISFPASIEVGSHPSYKRVTLNLMPTSGGAPRVLAYLYGGQGTLNVHSWSPDSKKVAFVSNWGK